jgi:hypothetical protein
MSKKMSEKESICLEKCYFFAENCRQKEDGTWDCKNTGLNGQEEFHNSSLANMLITRIKAV